VGKNLERGAKKKEMGSGTPQNDELISEKKVSIRVPKRIRSEKTASTAGTNELKKEGLEKRKKRNEESSSKKGQRGEFVIRPGPLAEREALRWGTEVHAKKRKKSKEKGSKKAGNDG